MILIATMTLAGCSQPPRIEKLQGHAQGTTFQISWWSNDPVDNQALQASLHDVLEQIDLWISNYRDDSLIEDFNRDANTDWQPLPSDVIHLLSIAKTIHNDSDGCYDPTIEPLFDLWGFRADILTVPNKAQIAAIQARTGYEHVQVDVKHERLRKTLPKLSIDMSSMGEGYTGWRFSRVLEKAGIDNYLVEFGGDMVAKGAKPDGSHWRVAIQRPVPGDIKVQKILSINSGQGVSINTSGTYRHYFDEQGRSYSHILDARTGAPVTHNLVSATVIGTDPRISDAWATAMLCLGQEHGMAVAREQHLAVFFIQQNQDGELVETSSPALRESKAVKFQ